MRIFYGTLDSLLVNAYAILIMKNPNFGGNRNAKIVHFMKEIASFLIMPYAYNRFQTLPTPRKFKLIIETCGMKKKVLLHMAKNLERI